MDIRTVATLLRPWIWLIVLFAVIGAAAGFGASKVVTPSYTSQAELLVGETLTATSFDLNAVDTAKALAQTYVELASTGPALDGAAKRLTPPMDSAALALAISVRAPTDSMFVEVAAQASDPDRAAAIANAVAAQLLSMVPQPSDAEKELRAGIDRDLLSLDQQLTADETEVASLTALPSRSAGQDARLQFLQDQIGTLRNQQANLLSMRPAIGTNSLTLVDAATPPLNPSSPRTTLNVGLGALLGMALAIAFALLRPRLGSFSRDPRRTTGPVPHVTRRIEPVLADVPSAPIRGPSTDADGMLRSTPTVDAATEPLSISAPWSTDAPEAAFEADEAEPGIQPWAGWQAAEVEPVAGAVAPEPEANSAPAQAVAPEPEPIAPVAAWLAWHQPEPEPEAPPVAAEAGPEPEAEPAPGWRTGEAVEPEMDAEPLPTLPEDEAWAASLFQPPTLVRDEPVPSAQPQEPEAEPQPDAEQAPEAEPEPEEPRWAPVHETAAAAEPEQEATPALHADTAPALDAGPVAEPEPALARIGGTTWVEAWDEPVPAPGPPPAAASGTPAGRTREAASAAMNPSWSADPDAIDRRWGARPQVAPPAAPARRRPGRSLTAAAAILVLVALVSLLGILNRPPAGDSGLAGLPTSTPAASATPAPSVLADSSSPSASGSTAPATVAPSAVTTPRPSTSAVPSLAPTVKPTAAPSVTPVPAFRLPKDPQPIAMSFTNGTGGCPQLPTTFTSQGSLTVPARGALALIGTSGHRDEGSMSAAGAFDIAGINPLDHWHGTLTATGGTATYQVLTPDNCTETYAVAIAWR